MISIPLMNHSSTAEKRQKYLGLLREAGAKRVFLCPKRPVSDPEALEAMKKLLSENIEFYTENGLEVGVWIGGLGHGGALSHEDVSVMGGYTRIRGLGNGGEADDSFCPLDPEFTAMYRNFIRVLAEAGARMIQIDDDLRISMHGPVRIGCACPLHMAELNRRAKDAGLEKCDYTREELDLELFTGKPTPIRKIWLDLQGDTLKNFAASLRSELDSIDPAIRLGHCACLSTWDTDGVDSVTVSRILAGSAKPFLRLIGAPYWTAGHAFGTTGLGSVIDLERMQFAWCRETASEIELMSEGDVYPRPRYKVPSSYLEAFHQVLTAEGNHDILKYMLDYTYDPDYETGYIRRHVRSAPLRESIAEAFADTDPAGIYVFEEMRRLAGMDCTGIPEDRLAYRLVSAAANFTGTLSLPISFERSKYTEAAVIVGDNAGYAPEDVVSMPLVLDAKAAVILTERGFDVGLESCERMVKPSAETFSDSRKMPVDTDGQYFAFGLKAGAYADSFYDNGMPAVYRYDRPDGNPVIVYAFGMESVSMESAMIKNYCRQEQLMRLLPVKLTEIRKEPGAYVLTRKSEDGLVVGIWNFGSDVLCPEKITLDGDYTSLTPIGKTEAALSGNEVTLGEMVPPYGFAGFTAKV